MKPQFTVILPTYNEYENVPILVEQILGLKSEADIRILIVDDDSPDGTGKVVEKLFGTETRVKILNRKGLSRGLVNSLNHGIESCDTEYLIWMDADLQMPADKIPEMISVLIRENVTAVLGSRFLPEGNDSRDANNGTRIVKTHKILSKLLSYFGTSLLRLPATDITSGFIAIRKSYFQNHKLHGSHGEYFIQLVRELHREGHSFSEIPYCLGHRQAGVSKSTMGNYLGMLKTGSRYIRVLLKNFLN